MLGCANATPTPTATPSSNPGVSFEEAVAYVKRVVFQVGIDSSGKWSGYYEPEIKRWDLERSSETGYQLLRFYLYEQSMTVERRPLPPTPTPTPIHESEKIAIYRNWFLSCANRFADKEYTKHLVDTLAKWPLRVSPDDSGIVLGPGLSYSASGELKWEEGKWRINNDSTPYAVDAAAGLLRKTWNTC